MARLSDDDRKAVGKARDEFRRRLLNEQSGVFTREDADVDKTFTYIIDGEYALTHDDLLCPNCDTLCHLEVEVNARKLHTRKTWRCPDCRSTSIGQFSTYVIQEWPGF